MARKRWQYALFILLAILLGIGSRKFGNILPDFLAKYAGDTLWALMVFLLIGFLKPALSTLKAGLIALIFAFSIEISQLYHAEWVDVIRATLPGALVLGHTFVWSDLLCYSSGVAIGVLLEILNRRYL